MRDLTILLAIAALIGSTPIQAAHDTGLYLPAAGLGQRGKGVGIAAGITIKFGPERVVKRNERIRLGIAAGPIFIIRDPRAANGQKRSEASLIGFEFKPGYSTSLNLSGRPVLARYTLLGPQIARMTTDRV